jgi:hypothetical protein
MNFTNRTNNRSSGSSRTRIYSNSQVYNNAIILHFESINNLTNLINESNNLLMDYNARVNSNTNNSLFSNNMPSNMNNSQSNARSNNYSMSNNETDEFENNISYLFRFDTLFPNSTTNTTNSTNSSDISYNIITINDNNKHLLDISNNNIDIFNILDYRNIENPLNDICPITRDRFYLDQNVYMIKKCKHIFNKSALNIWINNNNTCPTCRTDIR